MRVRLLLTAAIAAMLFATPAVLGGKGVIWEDDFSADLGWTGYAPAAWERDMAAASSGCSYGADPADDHSPTGDGMLLGYNIGGCYNNSIPAATITSPTIDCTGQEGVWLSFWRVLGVENNSWDQASVSVYDGSAWHEIYHNGSTSVAETEWSLWEYDVAAWANNNPNFQVQFTLGPADSSVNGCGWNIDDLMVFTLDDYCVSADPLANTAAAGEGFAATHEITLTNCGVADIDVDLSVAGNVWDTEITDADGVPITSVNLLYGEAEAIYVHVTVGATGNSDQCTLTATVQSPEKDTTVNVLLTTQKLLYYSDFATDPAADGWTGFVADEWEWGPATASSGCSGNQDPALDHSGTTDNNLLGFNIGGCYPDGMPSTLYVTSPAYDFSTMVAVSLDFWRILGVESSVYDHATVEASNDGATWMTVWQNGSSMSDPAWTNVTHDLSAIADGQSAVQLRFGMGGSDGSVAYCGWNIDDLGFRGSPAGFVAGTVSDSMGPIAGALVEVEGTVYEATTDATGHYTIALPAGTYTMTASALGHNPLSVTGVVVTVGQTTTQNFVLTYPDIAVSPEEVTVNVDWGQIVQRTVTISNTGNGPLTWTATAAGSAAMAAQTTPSFAPVNVLSSTVLPTNSEYSPWLERNTARFGTENRDLWDVVYTLSLDGVTSNNRHLAAEFDGMYFWVVSADPLSRANWIYKIDASGALVDSFPQGTSSDWGMRDMAFDGTYLYAGDEAGFYQIDPTDGSVTTLFTGTLGLGTIRALMHYPPNDSFIATNWGSSGEPFVEFDRAGTTIRSFGGSWDPPVGRYGLAYDEYTVGGPYMWIFDQSGVPASTLYQAEIEIPGSEALTGFTYAIPALPGASANAIAGGLFITGMYQPGLATIGGVVQDESDILFLLELSPYATWLAVDPVSGTVPAGQSVDLTLTFDSNEVEGFGVYEGSVTIASNDGDENPVVVPVTMIVAGGANLNGTVTASSAPVENALVTIVELELTAMTDAAGYYEFLQVMPGTGYHVTVEKMGFNSAEAIVDLPADSSITQDFDLTYPDIEVDPLTFEQTQAPNTTDSVLDALLLSNVGTGPADWAATVQYPPGSYSWLSVMPTSGTLEAGTDRDIALTFNSAGLMVGDYTAQVRFVSDPAMGRETVVVGVTLHVASEPTPTEPPTTPTMEPTEPPFTPTPTPTPDGPTATPTMEPTTPPTATPTEGPEPTATEVPATPTPECSVLGVTLTIPTDYISPNDTFWVEATVCSPDGPMNQVPFFALLDVGINEFWFYPGWKHYPPDIDWKYLNLPQGTWKEMVLPEFAWPDTGSGSFAGIYIHAALLNAEMTEIVGDFDSVSFGYGPQQ